MNSKILCRALLGLALIAGTTAEAWAGSLSTVVLTITNTPQTGSPGGQLVFNATVTNNSAVTQNLNGDSFTLVSPFTKASFNDSAFLNIWPLSLAPTGQTGSTYSGALFTVTIPNAAPTGTYQMSFNLLGGPGVNDQNLLSTANFQVNVVPEPATIGMMVLGVGAIALARARKSKA